MSCMCMSRFWRATVILFEISVVHQDFTHDYNHSHILYKIRGDLIYLFVVLVDFFINPNKR